MFGSNERAFNSSVVWVVTRAAYQSNLLHCEEESHNNHETLGRQSKGNQLLTLHHVMRNTTLLHIAAGLSHPFLGMGPGPMELGKLAAF